MAKRLRFYTWSADAVLFKKLRQQLARDLYRDDTGQGFHLHKSTSTEIDGRFVQKVAYTEEIISPDGSLTEDSRISYVHTRFRVRPISCGIVLLDPPRSSNALVFRLSQLLDHGISIEPSSINLIKLKRAIQKRMGQVHVTTVKILGAPLTPNAVGDITISDDYDALEIANEQFPNHRRRIGKIDMVLGSEFGSPRICASRSGALSINKESTSMIDSLWESVSSAVP